MLITTLLFFTTLFLAYWNGANDNFKGVATLYGSKTVSYRTAITIANLATFAGSICAIFLANGLIASFSGKGLVPHDIAGASNFLMAVGAGAAFTVLLATRTGFPVSTTHSLVGALIGSGLMAIGLDVNFHQLGNTFFIPLLISPFIALALAGIFYWIFTCMRREMKITKESCLCIGKPRQLVPIPSRISAHTNDACPSWKRARATVAPELSVTLAEANDCMEMYTDKVFGIYLQKLQEIALPINPETLLPAESNLVTSTITNKAAGQDFYGRIINTLEDAGGYMPGVPGKAVGNHQRQYYVFVYDWRQDNIQAARKLDQLIEQIRLDYSDPGLKVDIVAHSMGGLITRYYLRYGNVDVLNNNDFPVNNHGKSRVRKVILLGTPNLGSVNALQEFIQGLKVGLRRVPTEVLATMPSSYQLFPHPIRTPLIQSDGDALSRDIFDVKIWRSFEWSIFDPAVEQRIIKKFPTTQEGHDYLDLLQRYFEKHIERARRFVWSLTVPVEGMPVRLIVFGGDCEVTPASILVEEVNGKSIVRLYPDEVVNRIEGVNYEKLMLEPGDGRVTRASLFARRTLDPSVQRLRYSFFPLDYSILLCESHDSLTGNINFQNNLLNILLTRDTPSSQE